ncbi:MAG: HNH endonuclease [Candidatus Anammoximicrobium sp.]|nr:HNH endonuclease [Candidatus Anammoximicrobium sp.]
MATYILTWNPQRTDFDEDDYNDIVERTREGEWAPSGWSCGNTKRIKDGDRVFFLRQGEDRGMVGAGYATKDAYPGAHWSEKGKKAIYVDFDYETLLPLSFRLRIEDLEQANLGVAWDNLMASGRRVPVEFEADLESLWQDHLDRIGWQGRTRYLQPDEVPNAKTYVEGATRRVTVNAYERNREARKKCIAYYGPTCAACGFDFGRVYGEIGKNYIHVHHLLDLAEIGQNYEVDPIKDMRPVCPNCHTILHTLMPAMSIDRLRDILSYRHVTHSNH